MIHTKINSIEERMSDICNKIGLPFKVVWTQDPSMKDHGKIDIENHVIHIFDLTEKDAWATLIHEVLELKIRPLLSFYRNLVNTLIEFIEKHGYQEKEKFLESLPETLTVLLNGAEKQRTSAMDTHQALLNQSWGSRGRSRLEDPACPPE